MIKCIGIAVTAAAIAALAPAAWAQSSTAAEAPSNASSSSAATSGNVRATLQSADEIIGQAVRGTDGAEFGQIRDLVIDTQSGTITYAIVSSGGVVGIGGSRRAVPFTALSREADDAGTTIGIDRARWEGAPTFREDQLSTLAQRSQGESIYQYYGQTWNVTGGAVPGSPSTPAADDARVGQGADTFGAAAIGTNLVLASSLEEKEIRSGNRELGEIEDVLVDMDRRVASLLIELEDDFAASEESYVIGFNHLTFTGSGNDVAVTTQLSPADFQANAGAAPGATAMSTGQPYPWRGSSSTDSTYAATARASTYSADGDTPSKRQTSSSSVAPISGGVHTAGTGTVTDSMTSEAGGATSADVGTSSSRVATTTSGERRVRYADATENPQNRPMAPATTDAGRAASGATAGSPAAQRDVSYSSATANPQNRPTRPASPSGVYAETDASAAAASARATADSVRQALRQDATLRPSADTVAVSVRGDTIVLSGSVPSSDARDRVIQTARSVAAGQRIEDQIRIAGAAE